MRRHSDNVSVLAWESVLHTYYIIAQLCLQHKENNKIGGDFLRERKGAGGIAAEGRGRGNCGRSGGSEDFCLLDAKKNVSVVWRMTLNFHGFS